MGGDRTGERTRVAIERQLDPCEGAGVAGIVVVNRLIDTTALALMKILNVGIHGIIRCFWVIPALVSV